MKSLYYHPERIYDGKCSLIDNSKYAAVTHFLNLVESMTPEVVEDLKEIYDTYGEAEEWFFTHHKGSTFWPSDWETVKEANENFCSGYLPLKTAISQWANKYNLVGELDFYESQGLTSLSFYYDDCKELNRKKRMKEYKDVAEQFNVPLEAIRKSELYGPSWPYEEKLQLATNVFQEDEEDTLELSKSINQEGIHNSFFQEKMPFAFTPDNILQFTQNKDVYSYEALKNYYEIFTNLCQKRTDDSSFEMLIYSGHAWDPRTTTWKEFEESIDRMFSEYKELYRLRAENFLIERGYIKEGEKRNLDHFKWLVHYLIQRWSLRKIADYYSQQTDKTVNEDTIFHGIKDAARLVLIDIKARKS